MSAVLITRRYSVRITDPGPSLLARMEMLELADDDCVGRLKPRMRRTSLSWVSVEIDCQS